MIKVLVANADIKQNAKYCNTLANDKELEITSTTDGLTTLNTYLELKPNILILDSNFKDIEYTDILNKLSIIPDDNECNTIITTDIINGQLYSTCLSKVFRILDKSEEFNELLSCIEYLKSKNKIEKLTETDLNFLFIQLGIGLSSYGSEYLRFALYYCYYHPRTLDKIENVYNLVAKQFSVTNETVRSRMRTALRHIRIPKNNYILGLLNELKNSYISPADFLEICSSYLYYIKNKK